MTAAVQIRISDELETVAIFIFAHFQSENVHQKLRGALATLPCIFTDIFRKRRLEQDAIDKLNSLQSNFAAIEASRASGGRMVQFAKHETIEYLGRIGYSVSLV